MILSELGFVGFVDYRILKDRREYFANPVNLLIRRIPIQTMVQVNFYF